MKVRMNSRTFGYYRDDRMHTMQKCDQEVVRAEKMAEKRQASVEAETEMIKKLENAIYTVETSNAPELMERLKRNVLGMKMNPYGKLMRCIEELRSAGVETESTFWVTFIQTLKNDISRKTDPNKFYQF